jgi:hypothetical protein
MKTIFPVIIGSTRLSRNWMQLTYRTTIVSFIAFVCVQARSQDMADRNPPIAKDTMTVRALIGFPSVAPNTEGVLDFGGNTLHLLTKNSSTDIDKQRIIAVSVGDERIETGGLAGKLARVAIPYGGGLVLATATHRKIGLLTLEFLNAAGEYHGAVLSLRIQDVPAVVAGIVIESDAPHIPASPQRGECDGSNSESNSVLVEPISTDEQSSFPAEDRVLLYERVMQQLEAQKTIVSVFRVGDKSPAAACAAFTVSVHALSFSKGDQAVRASVGPLGHFVGTTKLRFRLTIAQQDGTPVFDKVLKKSEGSDSDSLNITKAIGKTVVKNLKKSRTQLRKSQMV